MKQCLQDCATDFARIAEKLRTVSLILRKKHYTYPIFLASSQELRLGTLLIPSGSLGNTLHYYAVYLAMAGIQKWITDPAAFKKTYKNPDAFCCLLMLAPDFNGLVYLPYERQLQ